MKINTITLLLIGNISLVTLAQSPKRPIVRTKTEAEQAMLTPWLALEKLKKGNERFVTGTMRERDLAAQAASSEKQFPFAVIVNCMDSRGSPELIFDQGIGDIFANRLAGNIVNDDVLGGLEFATKLVGAKLIVVLGHTNCGAIKGACDNALLGNLTQLLQKLKPAVTKVQNKNKSNTCEIDEIDQMAEQNVLDMMDHIKSKSPLIMQLIRSGKLGLVGAMHDLASGKIRFLEDMSLLPGAPSH